MRLPRSNDSRLLLAGVVAFVALVAYLAVAFANTHASNGPAPIDDKLAPWVGHDSKLVAVSRWKTGQYVVRVTPVRPGTVGSYGGLVPTLIPSPANGHRFAIGLWLKGSAGDPVSVVVDEFRPGATSVYVIQTTVPVTTKWRHFTFKARVKGDWLGLGMYVSRPTGVGRRTQFFVRGLTANLLSS